MTQATCTVCRQRTFKVDLLVKALETCVDELKAVLDYEDVGISDFSIREAVKHGEDVLKKVKGCNGC